MITALEFEFEYARQSGMTIAKLRSLGRVTRPCNCGEDDCPGWQSISRDLAEDEVTWRNWDEAQMREALLLDEALSDLVQDRNGHGA